jgi:hypothetical protein
MMYLILFAILLIVCVVGYLTSNESKIENVNISMGNAKESFQNSNKVDPYKNLNYGTDTVSYNGGKFYDTHASHHDQQKETFANRKTITYPVESETASGYMNITGVANIFNPVIGK